ncbi:DUF302 domain-containing protein [Edaphobacter aggregans]|uniref:DUF302 domain-containing protein n=1 Tax=Edaphobacter aggregans TaxID=570835 RepID=UPI00055725A7|nr:DUF302 domain-containing protein [Edaphobacter aggregans]
MKSTEIRVERFNVVSTKSFEETLAGLNAGIGRPEMSSLAPRLAAAESFSEFEQLVNGAVGTADLMEFLRLDLGMALRKDPAATAYKMIRIIAGNPLIMKRMAEHVPDVGSYAPVTILIYESQDGIHLAYDTMASFLSPYGNAKALEIAKDLDSKVRKLISRAVS